MTAVAPDPHAFGDDASFWAALNEYSRASAGQRAGAAQGREAARQARLRWPANPATEPSPFRRPAPNPTA